MGDDVTSGEKAPIERIFGTSSYACARDHFRSRVEHTSGHVTSDDVISGHVTSGDVASGSSTTLPPKCDFSCPDILLTNIHPCNHKLNKLFCTIGLMCVNMLLFCQFQAQFFENVNPICEKSFFDKIKLSTDICSNVLYIYTTNATVKEAHCQFCKWKINSDWLTYYPTTIFTFDDTRHLNPSSSRKWIIIQNKLKYINVILMLYMTMYRIIYFCRQDMTEHFVTARGIRVVFFLYKSIVVQKFSTAKFLSTWGLNQRYFPGI